MLVLFGGGLAITSLATLDAGAVAVAPVALGLAAVTFGVLVLYGSHLRRRR